MKKVLIIILAIMFAASMAYADPRLTLSGQMRVEAYNLDNYGSGETYPFDDDCDEDSLSYFDQRLRIAGKIQAAEGVTANFRVDLGEAQWGTSGMDDMGVRWDNSSELQVDRTYLQLVKGKVTVKAGQQYMGLGNSIALDANAAGVAVDFAANDDLTLGLKYAKLDEGAGYTEVGASVLTDEEDFGTEDLDLYALYASYKKDKFSGTAFWAMRNDQSEADNSPWVFGLQGNVAVKKLNINAELNYFGGDYSDEIEYFGTQVFVDASVEVKENVTCGAVLLYAQGTDDYTTEEQITSLFDFASWAPLSFGIVEQTLWDPMRDGFGGHTFDPFGEHTGIMGIAPYGEFTVKEKLILRAMLGYLMPADDCNSPADSIWHINAGAEYPLADNCDILASVQYVTATENDDYFEGEDVSFDPAMGMFMMMRVDF